MRQSHLLMICAVIETVTGLGLVLVPDAIATLLFSQGLSGAGLVLGRIAGLALLALGVACWGARHSEGTNSIATVMLGYNSLAAIYLASIGMDKGLTGSLLWPAVAVHALLALSFTYLWFSRQSR